MRNMASPKIEPHKFAIIISWSDDPDDQVFVADVPELPGCSAHGDTYEAALAEAQAAIGFLLEICAEYGDPIPSPGVISDIMRSEYVDLKKRGMPRLSPDVLRAQIDLLCRERRGNGRPGILD